jgi:6-pyruvoyltetrahydropterin/6-carboxytetrahydropterin synthase
MLLTCTRRLTFEAGHRVYLHESKCANLHGHSYKIEIEASAPELDDIGRIIDFSVLKSAVGGWIDDKWDHGFLLFEDDNVAFTSVTSMSSSQKVFVLPYNPTAENIARYLLEVVCPSVLTGTGVTVNRVVVHETENCKAEARR